MQNHAVIKILSLELRQVSNTNTLDLDGPDFRHMSGLNELSNILYGSPLICYTEVAASIFE